MTFFVLLLAYTLSQFFRAFLAIVAADLVRDLGLDAAQLGDLSAIWFASFAVAQFPWVWLWTGSGRASPSPVS